MPQLVEPTTPDAQREIIRQSLDEIATEVGTALRDAQLDFPVFLTVPNSGDSLATMASPLDPSDRDWADCACRSNALMRLILAFICSNPHTRTRYYFRLRKCQRKRHGADHLLGTIEQLVNGA